VTTLRLLTLCVHSIMRFTYVKVCVRVRVCVCVSEREREGGGCGIESTDTHQTATHPSIHHILSLRPSEKHMRGRTSTYTFTPPPPHTQIFSDMIHTFESITHDLLLVQVLIVSVMWYLVCLCVYEYRVCVLCCVCIQEHSPTT